jgi:hypothetical protein
MQVDRKPSRWPYAVTLVYLLILCLTVPRYWNSAERAERGGQRPLGASESAANRPLFVDPLEGLPGNGYSLFDRKRVSLPLSLNDPYGIGPIASDPTVEELVSSLDDLLARLPKHDDQLLAALPGLVAKPMLGSAMADDLMGAALRRARQRGDATSPGLALLLPPGARARQPESHGAKSSIRFRSPLRLIGPNDRVAMVTPKQRPSASVSSSPKPQFVCPWSTPVALLDQLQILAGHAYTADWARRTERVLALLSDNKRLPRGEAAAHLDQLRVLSDEAAQLAAVADNEVVRAELLRAHWGLERRLDCWTPMRQIAAHNRADRRVALRSPLSTTFNPLPGQAVEPLDVSSLSADLEAYEQSRAPHVAWQIREQQEALQASSDPDQLALAEAVENHYRNANIRITVTSEFLNRFVPPERTEMRMVQERIAGTPVRGQSMTRAANRLAFEPDTGRLRLGWETDGTVSSKTRTEGGAAQLHTRATTRFVARKPILVESDGVHLPPADAEADNESRVVGVESLFDWIPLVGPYIRSRALEKYYVKRPQAQAEVEFKVAQRAKYRLDRETGGMIERVEMGIRQRVTDPLQPYGVVLMPVELQTTSDRLVARLRLAAEDQLGSHTPRPTAPSDSLASVQLHESALTNAAVALELDGKRLSAAELQEHLREKFPRLRQRQPVVDEREDVVFQFADRNALQFHMASGQVQLTLAVVQFVQDRKSVRNFYVHAFYKPEINGMRVELVRDGVLGIEGRLGSGNRARLHNVFNQVFPEDHRLPLVQLDPEDEGRFAGLAITQLVLEDGWLGLAIGPATKDRVAERSRSLQ